MGSTTNYNLNIPSGSDQVNILTQITPNFETIDGVMKENEDAGIQVATELYSNNIHALTRTKADAPAMRFTATSNYTAGDTFTVDGVQVTALCPNGAALPDNAYVIGCEVFAILKGTRLTVWAGIRATDSEKLNGKAASFYATKQEVDNAKSLAEGATTIAQESIEQVGNIGIIYKTGGSFNLPTGNTGSIITSLQLPKGKYIIFYKGNFAGNSSGLRALLFDTAQSPASFNGTYYDSINSATGNSSTIISDFRVVDISATTTFYLSACQNSGTTLATNGSIFAVKVG